MHKKVVLSDLLSKLMKKQSLTLMKLSKKTGIPVSTIASYLSGEKNSYSPQHLRALAVHFGVSIDYLLFGEIDSCNSSNQLGPVFEGIVKIKIEKVLTGGL